MKRMYFTVLAVIVTLSMISCTEEEVAEQTLEDRVNNAKIIFEEFPFSQDNASPKIEVPNGSFLYIPTPSKDGYLKFESKSNEEKYKILSLVQKRFEREFEEVYKNNSSNGRTMSTTCGDWIVDNPNDPNSGVHRWCKVSIWFISEYYVETCVCGYCC